MEVIKLADLTYRETPWGVKGRLVLELPDVAIMNLVLEPGEKVPPHKTPVDVLFQVVEGRGSVEIGEERQEAEAGDIVVSPAKIPHALEADCGEVFSVLVYKVPNPKR